MVLQDASDFFHWTTVSKEQRPSQEQNPAPETLPALLQARGSVEVLLARGLFSQMFALLADHHLIQFETEE